MTCARLITGALCLLLLASCGVRERFFGSSGQGVAAVALPYRTSLQRGEDRRDFSVRVQRAVGATLEEIRESARFAATRYCLTTFGGSEVDWTLDAAGGDWAVLAEGDSLIVSGRCVSRV